MDKTYEVVWAESAQTDLAGIIHYIAEDSPANALTILAKIKKKASALYTTPERCRIVPELRENGIIQYHELIESHWRLIFRVDRSVVYVVSVLDARRNIEDILLDRFYS